MNGIRIPKLQKKYDEVFSLFIRLRDSNADGHGGCISCSWFGHYSDADNGHYFSRKWYSVRWDVRNCNLQCRKCNRLGYGAQKRYKPRLLEKWGPDTHDILEAKRHEFFKMSAFEYQEDIDCYVRLNKLLQRLKRQGQPTPKDFFQLHLPLIKKGTA